MHPISPAVDLFKNIKNNDMSNKLLDTYNEVMAELYNNSTPKADWGEIVKNGLEDFNFEDYVIPQSVAVNIVESTYKKKKLKKIDRKKLDLAIYLGHSPKFINDEI